MQGLMMDVPLLVSSVLEHAARIHGTTEIVARTAEGGIHRTTYAEVHTRAKRLAKALARLGVKPGDRVASLAWNTHHHFELFYGVSGSGAVLHTINPRLFEEQLVYIVNHAEDSWICVDAATLAIAERLAPQTPGVKGWIYMSVEPEPPKSSLKLLSYEKLLAAEDADYEWPQFDEKQASVICYTSGTTGPPKGVVNTHRSTILSALVMSTADMIGGYRSGAREVVMPIAPMFHGNGWQMVYTAPLSGQGLVLPGRNFEPDKLYEIMAAEKVTMAACVPTVWLMLVDHLDRSGLTLPSLRAALVAGTKPPRSLIDALEQRHGIEVAQAWGMTEALGVTKCALPPGLADAPYEQRVEQKLRQGRVAFSTKLRIVDDAGKPLPHDGVAFGHLQARGPLIVGAYLKQEAPIDDGWLQTGDVAKLFPDGTVEIVDRSKDVIKSGGEWISSAAVENAAMGHPAVAQAAVIGIHHPTWQERPLLVVVRKADKTVTPAELIAFLRPQMASWWVPEDVAFVDALPMTATGKIHKVTLRERFKDMTASGGSDGLRAAG
ncbi:long-chain fatty acid--CoA ligase [Reyranella sp.]|uniref:long-chain fatty acid--CoA ligase n=1 Tax=Reyranella sp. TaxID=1929291 RepID=UPI003D104615